MGGDDNDCMTTTSLQGAVRLADLGVVRAAGADAATFLHSQLTNDILSLDSTQARLAGHCSAKGRLLASFVVWRRGVDEVLLACSADLLGPALKKLSMFVLRARCKLTDASHEVALYGLAGDAATAWLGDAAPRAAWQRTDVGRAQVIRLPDGAGQARYLWAAPLDEEAPSLPALPQAAWEWMEVHSAVPRIVGATVEKFVPQMVNFEVVGGVNFQKGCYPGQEVFAADDPLQPAGMIVNAASLDAHAALVELKLSAAGAVLRLAAADGPALHPQPLPYPLPTEAA